MSGYQGRYELREIAKAIFYKNRTGCQWAYLPHDLPPKSATYVYLALWHDDGTDQAIHDLLRCQAREKAGRAEDPTAVVLDTQSIRAANHVPAATTGRDAGKKAPGRKWGLAVPLGLIIAVVVTARRGAAEIPPDLRPVHVHVVTGSLPRSFVPGLPPVVPARHEQRHQ